MSVYSMQPWLGSSPTAVGQLFFRMFSLGVLHCSEEIFNVSYIGPQSQCLRTLFMAIFTRERVPYLFKTGRGFFSIRYFRTSGTDW